MKIERAKTMTYAMVIAVSIVTICIGVVSGITGLPSGAAPPGSGWLRADVPSGTYQEVSAQARMKVQTAEMPWLAGVGDVEMGQPLSMGTSSAQDLQQAASQSLASLRALGPLNSMDATDASNLEADLSVIETGAQAQSAASSVSAYVAPVAQMDQALSNLEGSAMPSLDGPNGNFPANLLS